MSLFPATRFRLAVVEECGSTQEVLLGTRELASFHGSALLAHKQTAGRGRRGREWKGGTGNLALSMAFRLGADSASPALLPFLAGLALYDRVARVMPEGADLRLKWPNDLYLNGKKLAGMLAQARSSEVGVDVVLGIGVNLCYVPEEHKDIAICVHDLKPAPDAESFALGLLMAFEKVLASAEDFAWLKSRWEEKARLEGTDFWIVGEGTPVAAIGLEPSGELRVADAGGERVLSSEEVSLRYQPTMA